MLIKYKDLTIQLENGEGVSIAETPDGFTFEVSSKVNVAHGLHKYKLRFISKPAKFIEAIKLVRELTSCTLADAKFLVEGATTPAAYITGPLWENSEYRSRLQDLCPDVVIVGLPELNYSGPYMSYR